MFQWLVFALYSLGIHVGNLYIFIGSFFSSKFNLLYKGRKQTLQLIKNEKKVNLSNVIWVHCASLGEFEQGRPIIESIKNKYPNHPIVLSFFSPSGYEIRKNYELVDQILYLPSDLPANARALVKYFDPAIFILVKYEFWWNLLMALSHRKCEVFIISGVFRKNDYFFSPFLKSFRNILKNVTHIFTQDEISALVLKTNNIDRYSVVGDTRIDRVIANAQKACIDDRVKHFVDDHITIVYGSIWMSDVTIVRQMLRKFPKFKHIIAPHDISKKNIREIVSQIPLKYNLYSDKTLDANVLIIDNIGMLSSLYKIAKYAYIGGGFQKGIHNILEPSVFNIPVFFGPNHKKFNEAVSLCQYEAAFAVDEAQLISDKILYFENNTIELEKTKAKLQKYFDENRGATDKIVGHLSPYLDY